MTKKDFKQLLTELLNGELETLDIKKDEFIDFREVWAVHPERKKIIGEADYGGLIHYRVEKNNENK